MSEPTISHGRGVLLRRARDRVAELEAREKAMLEKLRPLVLELEALELELATLEPPSPFAVVFNALGANERRYMAIFERTETLREQIIEIVSSAVRNP